MQRKVLESEDGSKSVYYIDEQGNEIRVEDYDGTGALTTTIEREYSSKGICKGWVVRDSSGNQIKRFEVLRDNAGAEIATLQYDSADNLEHRIEPAT